MWHVTYVTEPVSASLYHFKLGSISDLICTVPLYGSNIAQLLQIKHEEQQLSTWLFKETELN